jgi:hypothetical protein
MASCGRSIGTLTDPRGADWHAPPVPMGDCPRIGSLDPHDATDAQIHCADFDRARIRDPRCCPGRCAMRFLSSTFFATVAVGVATVGSTGPGSAAQFKGLSRSEIVAPAGVVLVAGLSSAASRIGSRVSRNAELSKQKPRQSPKATNSTRPKPKVLRNYGQSRGLPSASPNSNQYRRRL